MAWRHRAPGVMVVLLVRPAIVRARMRAGDDAAATDQRDHGYKHSHHRLLLGETTRGKVAPMAPLTRDAKAGPLLECVTWSSTRDANCRRTGDDETSARRRSSWCSAMTARGSVHRRWSLKEIRARRCGARLRSGRKCAKGAVLAERRVTDLRAESGVAGFEATPQHCTRQRPRARSTRCTARALR
jgi:hypothetical protein